MRKFLPALLFPFLVHASCPITEISCPCYSGGLFAGGSWVCFQPRPSDADLQQSTLVTLTDFPPNIYERAVQVTPVFHNSFDVHVGFQVPCSNQSVLFEYFFINSPKSKFREIETPNQFFQNFLGSTFDSSFAHARHLMHRFDATYGLDFALDCCIDLHPFLGVGLAYIRRDFDVFFENFPESSPTLCGDETSKYWGVGPVFGTDFTWPLFRYLNLGGHFELGFLFGTTHSKLDSESINNGVITEFFAKDSDHRAVSMLNTKLFLVFAQPIFNDRYQLEIEVGYRVDTYFKPINRINPVNGYVNNPDPIPVNQPSNLGFQGPYITVNIAPGIPCLSTPFLCTPLRTICTDADLFFHFISSWLKPHPSKNDLTYALLQKEDTSDRQKVDPDTTWTTTYQVGLLYYSSYDIQIKYFHLDTQDSASTQATGGQSIASLNANGFANILFSKATSKARYEIEQVDVTLGKSMQLFCPFNLHGYFGVRYLNLQRTIRNAFFGGQPAVITQEKFPILKSCFSGVGPLFGLEPRFNFYSDFDLVGKFDTALVVGDLKATLDQKNVGGGNVALFEIATNTLRTPKTPSITTVLDVKGGIAYNTHFNCVGIYLEGGYQYTSYYRGIDLVFPNFFTGLEQNNSNLKLTGFYFDAGIDLCF